MESFHLMPIRIGAKKYTIQEVAPEHTGLVEGTCDGLLDRPNLILYLNRDLAMDNKVEVLWHEVIHGLLSGHFMERTEEKIATLLGEGLLGFTRDNGALVKTLLKRAVG
jgi:hypothetical protein